MADAFLGKRGRGKRGPFSVMYVTLNLAVSWLGWAERTDVDGRANALGEI